MKRLALAAVAVLLAVQTHAADPVGPKLTDRLRGLLMDEMGQVAQATADLALAIAAGDHARAMQLGAAIRDSFILKRSLTEQDKKDLMGAVPPEFVALDRRFHQMAGKLAHAAEAHDSELQGFYFAKMLDACVACHGHFASDRFPGLADAQAAGHEH